MNLPRRTIILLCIICLAMASSGVWVWGYLDDQQAAAVSAARELADCRSLSAQIAAARPAAAIAPQAGDITAAISSAAQEAGLAEGSLDHIDPGSARRNVDGTSAPRQIDLSIRQATLQQIVTFAHALSVPPVNLRATHLRLTPSEADGGGWAAEMTLTYPVSGDLNE